MNRSVLALSLLLTVSAYADRRSDQWIEKTLRSLSLDEKIGQLLVPQTPGGFRNVEADEFAKIRRNIVDFRVGGYHINSGGDVAGSAVLINDMQRFARVPLLITGDLEGGAGFIYPAATRLPLAMAIAATGSEDLAFRAAKVTAEEGRAMGINVDFYPVVDVQNNAGNPIINIRSFGEDVERVKAFTRVYVRGLQSNGMLATAKHFPGHGDTATDTHLAMPVIPYDRARLDSVELPPFRAAIEEGVAAVMSAHIHLPAFDSEPGLPATLSKAVMTGLLREEMKYDGLVFTDAMDMGAVVKSFGVADAAVRAIEAGSDVILYANVEVVFPALKAAVESGRLPVSRIDQSVRRILKAKARAGLDRYQPADVTRLSTTVGSKAHRDLAQQIYDGAVTLVRDERSMLPVRASDQRVLHLNVLDSSTGWREGLPGRVLTSEVPKRFPRAVTVQVDERTGANEYAIVRKMAEIVDVVIVAAFIRVADYKGSIDLRPEQLRLLRDLAKMRKPFVFALFGSPYLLHHVPELPSYILTYDTTPGAELAALKAITGEIPFRGKLPISLPGSYPVGHGLTR